MSKTTRSTSKTLSPSRRPARATGSLSSPQTARRPSRPTAPRTRTSPSCRSAPRSTRRTSRRAAPAGQTPCKDPNQGQHHPLFSSTCHFSTKKNHHRNHNHPHPIFFLLPLLRPTRPNSSGKQQPGSEGCRDTASALSNHGMDRRMLTHEFNQVEDRNVDLNLRIRRSPSMAALQSTSTEGTG